MEKRCAIKGVGYPESEGIYWSQLRPSLQEFLKTLKQDWKEEDFISYEALNDMFRAYIANLTAEEVKAHQALANKVQERFENEAILKPINPDLEGPPPTFAERMADKLAEFGGSWGFILIFVAVLISWITVNVAYLHGKNAFDPYPFILLNLVLSCIAAIQAPVIMMSQNRQADKDRERSEYDFKVNLKAEIEIRLLHEKIDHLLLHQHQNMAELFELQLDMMQQFQRRMETLSEKDNTNK